MSKSKRTKAGRPAGAKNITAVVDVEPSRCPKCKSSKRSHYQNPVRRPLHAHEAEAIIFHRCKCLDCGQWRIDREYVYKAENFPRPAATPADEEPAEAVDNDESPE